MIGVTVLVDPFARPAERDRLLVDARADHLRRFEDLRRQWGRLLICYFRDQRSIPPEKLTLERIDAAAITGFLDWLRTSRGNSASTCKQRLAAIDSFFTWMQTPDPARMACYRDGRAIPASRHDQPTVTHLSVEANPPAARRTQPVHPRRAAETRPCSPPCMTPRPGFKNSPI